LSSNATQIEAAPPGTSPGVLGTPAGTIFAPVCLGPSLGSGACTADDPDQRTNFGGKIVIHTSAPDILGVRAGVRTPTDSDFEIPYDTAAFMRVSAEGNAGLGLIQTGFGRTLRQPMRTCGFSEPEGKLNNYWETIFTNPDGDEDQDCEWRGLTRGRGKSSLYTVYFLANSDEWRAKVDGVVFHTQELDFAAAALATASGEIVDQLPEGFDHPDGTLSGCFGCTSTPKGLIPWQFTMHRGSSAWTKINSAADLDSRVVGPDFSDDRWAVSGFPGPFKVSHTCFADHSRGC